MLTASATMGFLFWNFPVAKIFMGDSGSLFIGFVLACMPIYTFKGVFSSYAILLGISFLIIPIYDTLAAIIRRKIRGVPFHSPDMDHLHHKLLALGLSEKVIIFIIAAITIISSTLALYFVIYQLKLFIYLQLLFWVVILVLFILLSKSGKKEAH